jgi:hypothetical protein
MMSITRVPRAHRGPVYAVAAAPGLGGRWRIFTVGSDKLIRSWDAVRFLAAADAGGTAMLVYATDRAVTRVDRTAGMEIGEVEPPPGVRWTRVRLGAVGLLDDAGLPLVIAGDTEGAIFRWDLRTGEPVGDPIGPPIDSGQIVVVAGHDDGGLEIIRWEI